MKRKAINIWFLLAALTLALPMLTACSDEPDSENFRTFDDEMMSTYLQNRPQYSEFAEIVTRSGMMNLLSTYGSYTCFAPNNDAVDRYLANHGLRSIDDLTDADCDTIARTHLLDVLYSTFDIPIEKAEGTSVLPQPNMNDRYLEVSLDEDTEGRQVICINGDAHIYFELKDDSVVNGIVQPIDRVLESSNRMLPDIIKMNPGVSIFYEALQKTGLRDSLFRYKDENYQQVMDNTGKQAFWKDYTTGDNIRESARSPKEKLIGYTAFVVSDSILKAKYNITTLEELYQEACRIYDPIFGGESEDYHALANATDRRNPLNRLISYHLLNRNVHGYNLLTVINDYGVRTNRINPMEWYGTLLPYAMLKVEKLRMAAYMYGGSNGDIFLNRRVDDRYMIPGVKVLPDIPNGYSGNAMNGYYFCIDGLLKYDKEMTEEVMNCRMRMDMSTIFPEVMTNNMRMNYKSDAALTQNDPAWDHEETLGTNYFFPDGYLDGVTVGNNGYFIYRRPRLGFYSYCGDEFICQDNFDVTFRIPPVPTEGDYQVRLGYAAMSIRGIAQVYFGTEGNLQPQGIPLDMRRDLSHETILGSTYWSAHADYDKLTEEEKSEELKELKNKGFYRGCQGGQTNWNLDNIKNQSGTLMSNMAPTLRIVLCTVHMRPNEDYYLRFRCVSEGLGNNEIMLDYLEIVPKSVYGVTDEGVMEDPN